MDSLPFSLLHRPHVFLFLGKPPGSGLDGRRLGIRLRADLAHPTNFDRGFEDGSDGDDAAEFVRRYGCQTHGCDASARTAVRISSELTGNDFGFQVRG